MNRPILLFLGVFATFALWAGGLYWKGPIIEADLTERSMRRLNASGLQNVRLEFDGRDGEVSLVGQRLDDVRKLVEGVEGVRIVNQATLALSDDGIPSIDPSFQLKHEGSVAIVTGALPSNDMIMEVERVLTSRLGADQVNFDWTTDKIVSPKSGLDNFSVLLDSIGANVEDPEIVLGNSNDGKMSLIVNGRLVARRAGVDPSAVFEALTDSTMEIIGLYDTAELAQVSLNDLLSGQRVAFVPGRFELTNASTLLLRSVADSLNLYSEVRVSVEGHTDANGNAETNLLLSMNRANTVVDFLIGRGIERARLESKGFGETVPIASNNTSLGRRTNRRVEFVVK